jgi:hypothetical protein
MVVTSLCFALSLNKTQKISLNTSLIYIPNYSAICVDPNKDPHKAFAKKL